MTIGIIGLGLIGGSLAKALKQTGSHTILGSDISKPVVNKAILIEAIDSELTCELIEECEILIIALYPQDTIDCLREKAHLISKDAIVLDTCGIKEKVCNECTEIANQHGFTFIGAHPMAGIEASGFDHARKTLFRNASLILTPSTGTDICRVAKVKELFREIGFGMFEITTPEKHDEMIAYTSQLAHVLSSAYVKNPAAMEHTGFSAGSFNDMTRVAKLNEKMWTELFTHNKDNLINALDMLISNLGEYSLALKNSDEAGLCRLLKEGRERKDLIDGKGGKI